VELRQCAYEVPMSFSETEGYVKERGISTQNRMASTLRQFGSAGGDVLLNGPPWISVLSDAGQDNPIKPVVTSLARINCELGVRTQFPFRYRPARALTFSDASEAIYTNRSPSSASRVTCLIRC
jgi:hypothetical protein